MHLAEKIVLQFGEPNNIDAQQWLSEWIDQQCPALNNVKPIELLDSDEGALEVEKVLWRMVTGVTA
ncbi:antitoxin Xre/MbcA/ParS toxin-binding domain-containing protein [Comamonas sp. SY3]|uniref:antitoxin Xre/MbcA/ParS toxin-binding domain-containing protein n=1 Tax=Comamonas sp. SY3 TaxID=3243601 RepID=UPI0035933D2C